jgi:hypothetical protein
MKIKLVKKLAVEITREEQEKQNVFNAVVSGFNKMTEELKKLGWKLGTDYAIQINDSSKTIHILKNPRG